VVAKLLRPDQVGDPRARGVLESEAHMLRRLAHPLLLRSFGSVLEGVRPHLVLEYVDGPRLSTLMRRYGVVAEQLLPLVLNLSSVLHYLGEEGVVHLDVKPRNVIMAGSPKLIDLSVARTLDGLRDLRSPVGTSAYMAPEQCDPARFGEIGPAADVWALGVTLFEGLARSLPFPDDGQPYPQLRHAPRPLPPRTHEPVAELIDRCLARAPSERPTAAQVGEALEPVVEALPQPSIGRFRPGAPLVTQEA
jgi:serine/threonine protein kinase